MRKIALALSLALLATAARAQNQSQITLPKILSDHMVLQRNRPIHLWGWAGPDESVTATISGAVATKVPPFHTHAGGLVADSGESITATISGAVATKVPSATTKADGLGHWSLYLPPEPAGGPDQITITGPTNTITLTDVMIGDVWFASGQSNMELPLMGFPGQAVVTNGQQEIRNATHSELRLLHIPEKASPYPQQGQPATWTLCTPETAASFSAAAYFFGREIAAREHVTIGLIDSTWGGTPAEAWLSMDSLGADAALMPVFAEWAHVSDDYVDDARRKARDQRENEAARAAHRPLPHDGWYPNLDSWNPSWLYNGMVAPAINFTIKGVIWYQGETNSANERASMYERIFPALITDWRKQWQQGNFPFLYVQISSFTSDPAEGWPVIREAQRRTLKLENTAMVVTTDIGTPDNVHPPDKQDVGHRLALAARALAYHEPIEYSGPMYRQTAIDGNSIRVWFDHAEGLTAKCGMLNGAENVVEDKKCIPTLTGFEIAGEDKKFVPATARIENPSTNASENRDVSSSENFPATPTVLVSSPEVPEPKYVRYDWTNAPQTNLFNAAGLPASPFTSEKEIPTP